jgi:uncharacterized repeat protein (TIGR03803 family)
MLRRPRTSGMVCLGRAFCSLLGLIFTPAIAPAQTPTYSVLYNFGTNTGDPQQPGALTQGRDGNLYGVSTNSGANSAGTVFKVTPAGTVTVLYSFDTVHGMTPSYGLALGTDGNFYGATSAGGSSGKGIVFQITPAGTLTVLYQFTGAAPDGGRPTVPPVQGTDGNWYGTAYNGGSQALGSVYKLTSAGQFTTLYSFSGGDGEYPNAPLIQGTDGNFYGTTVGGGPNASGTVFKITPAGQLTTLYSFVDFANGAQPDAPLVQANDGDFYSTTTFGGLPTLNVTNNGGVVYKITSVGNLNVVYKLQSGANDGFHPQTGLVQATDGNFYGTTSGVGTGPGGHTLFVVTPQGSFSTLHSFDGTDGEGPDTPMVQHTNGILYGDTAFGGSAAGGGVFYSVSAGLGPFVALVPSMGKVGDTIGILGQGFTGTTAVSFNGTSASFTVESPTFLTATVPTGATMGSVTVTTPTGALISNKQFVVGLLQPGLSFSPSSLIFTQAVGTTSPARTVTVTNAASIAVNFSNISVGGANAASFAETDTCTPSLASGASCQINVTFTPSSAGASVAFVSVTDTAPGSPHTINLTGSTPAGAPATVSPSSVTFPDQFVGTSGLPQTVTLTNTGTTSINIANVSTGIPADFAPLSTCSNSLAAGASCNIGVFFDPSASGTRTGTLTITDGAGNSPQTVSLTGTGQDFSMTTGGSATATIMPGQTANYMIGLTPGGGFNQPVTLSCSGAPAMSTCAVSPSTISLSGSSAVMAMVAVTTTAPSKGFAQPLGTGGPREINYRPTSFLMLALPGMTIILISLLWRREQRLRWVPVAAVAVLVWAAMTLTSCSGGSGSSASGGSPGTQAGTYTIAVSGNFSSGSTTLTHSTQLKLVVQ